MPFELRSTAFEEGGLIPPAYTCDGADLSPPLFWRNAPEGTRSFVLIVQDADAPSGNVMHWILYDIPGESDHLPEGAETIGTPGINGFGNVGYNGPCPGPGGPHRYLFTLYAVDRDRLDLPGPGAPPVGWAEVERALQGHILGQAQLTGRYERLGGPQ